MIQSIRAYSGINIAKTATVDYEPSIPPPVQILFSAASANALLVQEPRTNTYRRQPLSNINDLMTTANFNSCVIY